MKAYLVDIGRLIKPGEKEFEQYSIVYDKKYGYWDRNQYYSDNLYNAMKDIMEYVKNNNRAYGIVTKQEIQDNILEIENVKSISEVPLQLDNTDYTEASIVFSACNENGKVKQNFITNPNEPAHYYIDKDELHNLVYKGYKQGLVNIGIAPNDSGCSGICCNIANGWFYFDGKNAENYEDNLTKYLAEIPEETRIDAITEAIWGIYEELDDYEDNEAWYYYMFLKNNVKEYNNVAKNLF